MASAWDRFWSNVSEQPNGCWQWIGWKDDRGYGRFSVRRYSRWAHRVAWRLLRSPIPSWLQIDHLCRNRSCVNPGHMELVTPQQNILRGTSLAAVRAQRELCPQGHRYDASNTYISKRNERHCRTCHRKNAHRARAARKAMP